MGKHYEYNGKRIIRQTSARLVPENNILPDCMCSIMLTEDTLYVLEREPNGEYTVHYAIPCGKIECIESYFNTERRVSGGVALDPPSAKYAFGYAFAAIMAALGGFVIIPRKKANGQEVNAKYLRIIYIDDSGKKQWLYFNEVSGSIKAFSNAFNSINTPM